LLSLSNKTVCWLHVFVICSWLWPTVPTPGVETLVPVVCACLLRRVSLVLWTPCVSLTFPFSPEGASDFYPRLSCPSRQDICAGFTFVFLLRASFAAYPGAHSVCPWLVFSFFCPALLSCLLGLLLWIAYFGIPPPYALLSALLSASRWFPLLD